MTVDYRFTDAEASWLYELLAGIPDHHRSRVTGNVLRVALLARFHEQAVQAETRLLARRLDSADPICVTCKFPKSARHHSPTAAAVGGLRYCDFRAPSLQVVKHPPGDPKNTNPGDLKLDVVLDDTLDPGTAKMTGADGSEVTVTNLGEESEFDTRHEAVKEHLATAAAVAAWASSPDERCSWVQGPALSAARYDTVVLEALDAVMTELKALRS